MRSHEPSLACVPPTRELPLNSASLHQFSTLTVILLMVQVICSLIAFTIRYPLAYLLYGEIIA